MKTFIGTFSEEIRTVSPVPGKSVKDICSRLPKYILTFIFAMFLFMIVTPADASTGSVKSKKSGCKVKRTSFSYPVIITGKNKSMVYNKSQKKSRTRNFSFPV